MDKNKKSPTVTATEFKQSLGKHLDYVCDKQDDVVITKNGEKIARLTPYISNIEQYYMVKETALDYSYGGKRVTYEEFRQISNNSELRMELIDGEIYVLASPNYWHQEILGYLHIEFKRFFKGKKCKVSMAPFDIKFLKKDLDEPDVLQPDLFVICDFDEKMSREGKYSGIPTLVLEIISVGTQSKDMVKKLNSYMMSGVKEYWVVDPMRRMVGIYSFTDDRGMGDYTVSNKSGEKVVSMYFEGLSVDYDELFEVLPDEE